MNIDMTNAIFFIGRIGKVEAKTIGSNNTRLLEMSVVQDDGYYQDGKWKEDNVWVDVEAFNGVAEYGEPFCLSGQKVGISGKLRTKEWTDTETGKPRRKHYILATSISRFLKPANGENASGDQTVN